MSETQAGTATRPSSWPLVVLCTSLLVVTIQTSILNVALPSLVHDLGASDSQLQWFVDAYIVAFAGVLLTGSALADRYGRRGVMTIGLVICGVSSILAGVAQNPTQLIVWRTIMGIGAALVMPATLSILVNVYTERAQRTKAIAYWSLMNATGSFIGPITGGLLLRWATWNFCFYVNIPFVIAAVIMGHYLVPTSKDPSQARFDVLGAILSTGALASLVWAIIEGPNKGWTSPAVASTFIVAVVLLVAFVVWELHTPSPMLDLPLFAKPQLSAAAVALTIAFLAMSGAMYLSSLALQFVKGYTPLAAAVAVSAPITLVNFIVVPRAPWLIHRFGTRVMVSGGIATIACSALIIATLTRTSGYWVLCLGFAMMALAFSTFVPASTEAIMTAVPAERSGGASAVNELTRQVGQALGIALGGGITAIGYHSQFDAASVGLTGENADHAHSSLSGALSVSAKLGGEIGQAVRVAAENAYIHGIRLALMVAAGAALLGALYAALGIPSKHELLARDDYEVELDPTSVDAIGSALETS
ncbi:MFS transporter [Jatrophihabitans sp. DSM 45814]